MALTSWWRSRNVGCIWISQAGGGVKRGWHMDLTSWCMLHLDTKRLLCQPLRNSTPVSSVSMMNPGDPALRAPWGHGQQTGRGSLKNASSHALCGRRSAG